MDVGRDAQSSEICFWSNRFRVWFSSSNIASTITIVFVPPSNNVEIENNDVKTDLVSENIDKGKSILGAPPKQDKKEVKNSRTKKANSQKPKKKKQHLCHHCGVAGHTRPNCYKWLATQQCNGMIVFGSQNHLQSSLAPLGDFLKALMFHSNLNGFNSSPLSPVQGFNQRKCSSRVWKENGSKWFCHFSLSFLVFVFALLMCFAFKFWVSLVFMLWLFNMFLFDYFSVLLCFVFHIKKKLKKQNNTKAVCVLCTLVLVYLGWPLK